MLAKLKRKKTSLTAYAIKFIKALYRIEDEADANEFSVRQRHAVKALMERERRR